MEIISIRDVPYVVIERLKTTPELVIVKELVLFHGSTNPNYIFSNFYPYYPRKTFVPLNIIYEGQSYPTAEHLYQALKFRVETEAEKQWREIIRTASTPTIAKHLGGQRNFRSSAAAAINMYKDKVRLAGNLSLDFRIAIMTIAIEYKYRYCAEFREALNRTKNKILMENTKDDWGFKRGILGSILAAVRDKYI